MVGIDSVYSSDTSGTHEGRSIRQMARDLGVGRDTARNYIGDTDAPGGWRQRWSQPVWRAYGFYDRRLGTLCCGGYTGR